MNSNYSWLVQRISKPQDYINPFGDNIGDVKDDFFKQLNKDFPMEYMGAAEFEGNSLINTMCHMYDTKMVLYKMMIKTIRFDKLALKEEVLDSVDPKDMLDGEAFIALEDNKTYKKIRIPVWLWIPASSLELDYAMSYKDDVQRLYNLGLSGIEVTKSDFGSFSKAITDRAKGLDTNKTIGWMSVSNKYAFFLDEERAVKFGEYINEGEHNA